jgi:hypothetical protein
MLAGSLASSSLVSQDLGSSTSSRKVKDDLRNRYSAAVGLDPGDRREQRPST